jgi:hypothetical protein
MLGLLLVIWTAFAEAQASGTALSNLNGIVAAQIKTVQAQSPDAKLFQVFVLDAVPARSLEEQASFVETHSFFEVIPGATYAEATNLVREPDRTQVIVSHFNGRDCFYGHPTVSSETCGPTIQAPSTPTEYLPLDWNLDLTRLATALRKHDMDPSKHFDITIVSAKRAISTWKSLQTGPSLPSEIAERLAEERPNSAVVAVTERPTSRTHAGPTLLLRGSDLGYLGMLQPVQPRKMPPAR